MADNADWKFTLFDHPPVAVVHGASRGIGLEFVRQLLNSAAAKKVYATCREPQSAANLRSLAEQHAGRLGITVDTDLSKPFQSGVAPEKLFTPTQAVRYLCNVIDGLNSGNNGEFLPWDGQSIPW